jgi:nucleotide-binding universal stress UspA family protein
MRILIGYNGTEPSRAAIEDLRNAGLPQKADALVLTIAEICFPTVKPGEAGRLAAEGCVMVSDIFPEWNVECSARAGHPVSGIIEEAERFHPDLIVLGEPNREEKDLYTFLGPVSQGLLTAGSSALRISRAGSQAVTRPLRLLVGFDGSTGAELAVNTILNRNWPAKTQVQLLSIDTSGVIGALGQLSPQMKAAAIGTGFASGWAETLAGPSMRKLIDAGLDASIEVRPGQPRQVLVEASAEWSADCIFVAPHTAGNSFERFLLGSVSAAVAAQANCTVEVVRPA